MTTNGVPLDPAWPQDHARTGGNPDFRIPDPEIRKNRKMGKKSCDLSFQSSFQAGWRGPHKNPVFRIPDPENLENGKNGERSSCIYIILQKAMRPIGRSSASTLNKSELGYQQNLWTLIQMYFFAGFCWVWTQIGRPAPFTCLDKIGIIWWQWNTRLMKASSSLVCSWFSKPTFSKGPTGPHLSHFLEPGKKAYFSKAQSLVIKKIRKRLSELCYLMS